MVQFMKKTNIMLIFLLVCTMYQLVYSTIADDSCIQKSPQESSFLAIISSIKNFYQTASLTIEQHPYTSSCILYYFLHMSCDCIKQYWQQQSLNNTIILLQEIAVSLIAGYAIDNYLHYTLHDQELTALNIQTIITERLPYSFAEIETICHKTYQTMYQTILMLYPKVHLHAPEFMILSRPKTIDLKTLQHVINTNKQLQHALHNFKDNPTKQHLDNLLVLVQRNLTLAFIQLEQKLLYHDYSLIMP